MPYSYLSSCWSKLEMNPVKSVQMYLFKISVNISPLYSVIFVWHKPVGFMTFLQISFNSLDRMHTCHWEILQFLKYLQVALFLATSSSKRGVSTLPSFPEGDIFIVDKLMIVRSICFQFWMKGSWLLLFPSQVSLSN